ncbi:MAG: MurR/RpiR family transcriptional regulator [Spirochaetota bacterium]
MKIKEAYQDLKPKQKMIADYFLEVDFEGINASIDEIARIIGTSVASISRFCKKLNYDNFQRFKISLSQDLKYSSDVVLPIFRATDDDDLVIQKVFAEAVTNLHDTEKRVEFGLLKQAVEKIVTCEMLYFIGQGGSGGVCSLGRILFSHIGYKTVALVDTYETWVCMGHVKSNYVVVGISHTGKTAIVVNAVREARKNGAFTIAITNYPDSQLAKSAHIALLTACYEGRIHFAQSNSMITQIALLNALYLLTASRCSHPVIENVNKIEGYVSSHIRMKK